MRNDGRGGMWRITRPRSVRRTAARFTALTVLVGTVMSVVVGMVAPLPAAAVTVNTTTTLISSANPIGYGQPVTLTATVSWARTAAPAPTGTVEFDQDGFAVTCDVGDGTLGSVTTVGSTSSASTSCTYTPALDDPPYGQTFDMTATFNSDGSDLTYTTSTSDDLYLVEDDAPFPTTTLTSSANPIGYGQPVTLTATVSWTTVPDPPPTGTVEFNQDGAAITCDVGDGTLGSVTTVGSTSSASTACTYTPALDNPPSGQTFDMTAIFNPDGSDPIYQESISNDLFLVEDNAPSTTTTLTSSANPIGFGQPVTLTATVSWTTVPNPPPTGTVEFDQDGNPVTCDVGNGTLGSVTTVGSTSSASASCTYTPTLDNPPSGQTFDMTATFNGDGSDLIYSTSTSSDLFLVEDDAPYTTTTLTSSDNPIDMGQSVTLTATVSWTTVPDPPPTGTVEFDQDGNPVTCDVGDGTLGPVTTVGTTSSASTSCTYTPALDSPPTGQTYDMTATFNGDGSDLIYLTSTSDDFYLVNNGGPTTTTTLTSSANPSGYEKPITETATVSWTATANPGPTDTVEFDQDGNPVSCDVGDGTLGPVTTVGGISSASTSCTFTPALDAPPYGQTFDMTATYDSDGSDPIYQSSTSDDVWQAEDGGQSSVITLGFSQNPSPYNTAVTITADVRDPTKAEGVAPTGTVAFTSNGSPITCVNPGDGTLNAISTTVAVATCTYTPTVSGGTGAKFTIQDIYSGDQIYSGSHQTLSLTAAGNAVATNTVTTTGTLKVGSSIILTDTVSGGGPVPTGSVYFSVDSGSGPVTITCNGAAKAALSKGGVATCPYTPAASGSYSVTALYSGDTTYNPVTSAPYSLVIGTISSATATPVLTSPASVPVGYGVPVTVSTTVTGTGPVPTGTVTFTATIGAHTTTPSCGSSATLDASGQASCTFTPAFSGGVGGTVSVTASYSGDSTYAASSSSAPLAVAVDGSGTPTGFTVGAAKNPMASGNNATYTVRLAGTPKPSGTVTFADNGSTSWQCGTSGSSTVKVSLTGVATCIEDHPTSGLHDITVAYSGDAHYAAATGPSVTEQVNGVTKPGMTLTSSSNPVAYGGTVTFTATVSGASGTPTGTVIITVNGTPLACPVSTSTTLDGTGAVHCTWSSPLLGGGYTERVTASYSGDVMYAARNSNVLLQTVDGTNVPNVALTSNYPTGAPHGTRVTLKATVTGSSSVPTGKVVFVDTTTSTTLCTAALSLGGVATCVHSFAVAEDHVITAEYLGDVIYQAANATFTQHVS